MRDSTQQPDARPEAFQAPVFHAESRRPGHVKPLSRPVPLGFAKALAFVMFEKPDLEAIEAFLLDFGMATAQRTQDAVVMRGAGPAPCIYLARKGPRSRYLGAAFEVGADYDFDRVVRESGAVRLDPAQIPGGGRGVALADPAGHAVWLVTGQKTFAPLPPQEPAPQPFNRPEARPRINETIRYAALPAQVVKAGHVVLRTTKFADMTGWYMRHLGLIPTDVQYLGDGSPNLAFMRFDLRDTPADHHAVVIAGGIDDEYEHSAYEVRDLDTLGLGQQALRARGHRHLWGIGRHVIGSQLFDYWFDPDGEAMEHYADGDVFTRDYETHYSPLNLSGLYSWGADLPEAMKPKRSLGTLLRIARLVRSGRLSLARLKLLGRAFHAPARPWL
ncbi:biphenyl-2,3-diol 1,2-dioxygenase [Ramlibacter henchirensis]|uniref:Biphenyl-2,3-diol 1,2-dioxygenase n=1 Tax=Ramlibacter henchirensis TaxID=204072 RepID=A0A4Z0C320_9BURK|nr:VOC family protein [Ramlibacter henchirensis]TFZ05923.1 biphenyl-2,3-diol 1,2-dioxygenase [Ramlibacter henchirensis]